LGSVGELVKVNGNSLTSMNNKTACRLFCPFTSPLPQSSPPSSTIISLEIKISVKLSPRLPVRSHGQLASNTGGSHHVRCACLLPYQVKPYLRRRVFAPPRKAKRKANTPHLRSACTVPVFAKLIEGVQAFLSFVLIASSLSLRFPAP
jgi:hypothetical protein